MGEDQPFMEILHEVLRNYGKSVLHGHTHIYQSMPRMLTIWFEYGNYCSANPAPSGNKANLFALHNQCGLRCTHLSCYTGDATVFM